MKDLVYPIPTCSILFYVSPGCSMCVYSVLYMSTVVYMCLEWPWENGVFIRDSAGIRRVLWRTLFGCCSDFPGECSGVLRRNAKKVRTKSVVIPAQDRIDTGFRTSKNSALYLVGLHHASYLAATPPNADPHHKTISLPPSP